MRKKAFLALAAALPVINYIVFKKGARLGAPKGKFYKWRFGNIHYTKSGSGAPILMVHGISPGCGLHNWEDIIALLSGYYTVYAIDLLGMGYSDKPNISYSAYMYAQLISDFTKNVIKAPAFVCAEGHGAAFAAAALALRKDLFLKMILLTPNNGSLPTEESAYLKMLLESPVIGASIYAFISSKIFRKLTQTDYNAAHYNGANAKYAYAAYLSGFLNANVSMRTSGVRIPIMVQDKARVTKEFYRTCRAFFR